MIRMMVVFAMVTGCWTDSKPAEVPHHEAAAGPHDCGALHAARLSEPLVARLVARCTDDHWAGPMIDCFASATSERDVEGCSAKLPADQARAIAADIAATTDVIARMAEFKDSMCQCIDKPCADRVQEQMNAWAQDLANEPDRIQKASADDMKKMSEIGTDYGNCMMKAMGVGTP